jgi:hypothetical protein
MARSGQQRPHARSLRSAGMYEHETKPDAVSEELRRTANELFEESRRLREQAERLREQAEAIRRAVEARERDS